MSEVITRPCHSASANTPQPVDLQSEWLEVVDDTSMSPEINPGDQVLITYGLTPKSGDIALVRQDGRPAMLRRYLQATRDIFLMKPENGEFKTLRSDVCRIELIGVVRCRTRSFQ